MTSTDEPIDILLIGLGSIGTIYAFLLEKSGKARVTAVARSNYKLYSEKGVKIQTDRFGDIENFKPYRVVKSQAEALEGGKKYALCVVCTKCLPDVLPNTELLADVLKSGQVGAYVLIQNGLEIEADLAKATKSPVISCLGYISGVPNATGDVVTWRGPEKLVTGLYPPASDTRKFSDEEETALNLFLNTVTAGGGNVLRTDNIVSMRFVKNVWNCTWACLQGLIRCPQTCFADLSPQHHAQVKKYMRELFAVGTASGLMWEGMDIEQPGATHKFNSIDETVEADFIKFANPAVRDIKSNHKWSMFVDIEQGRPFEVEVIVGSVVKIAREHNVDTPLLDFVYTLLSGVQEDILLKRRAAAAAEGR